MSPFGRKTLALSKSYAKDLLKDGTVEVDTYCRVRRGRLYIEFKSQRGGLAD